MNARMQWIFYLAFFVLIFCFLNFFFFCIKVFVRVQNSVLFSFQSVLFNQQFVNWPNSLFQPTKQFILSSIRCRKKKNDTYFLFAKRQCATQKEMHVIGKCRRILSRNMIHADDELNWIKIITIFVADSCLHIQFQWWQTREKKKNTKNH